MAYENNISQTGYVTYIKEIGKMVSISLGIGVKQPNNEYKTGFLEVRGSKELLGELKKGDKIKVKGFVSFNFWTKDDKDMQKIVMVVTEAEVDNEPSDKNASKKSEETPKKEAPKKEAAAKAKPAAKAKKEEELPEIDLDTDEIPF